MPLWLGKTWKCPRCSFENADIRTKCRNLHCTYALPNAGPSASEQQSEGSVRDKEGSKAHV